jgi:hypothetical protein
MVSALVMFTLMVFAPLLRALLTPPVFEPKAP